MDKKIKTPVRWAGSKKRLLPQLAEALPNCIKGYCEPFCGSACLFFSIGPKFAVLGDLNTHLTEFYEEMTLNPHTLWHKFCAIERSKNSYYSKREQLISEKDRTERAATFYFLNRNCFNGIYRTNKQGHFNVPYSASRVPKYLSFAEFSDAAKALQSAKIQNADFEETCRQSIDTCDFFYLDPPYFDAGKRIFREYDADCFSPDDFPRFIQLLRYLDSCGKRFLVSFPATDDAIKQFSPWMVSQVVARRTVSAKLSSRSSATELLVRNY